MTLRRPLFHPPRLRSEQGLEEGRRATWLELFFDLVFVAAVAQVGTHLRDDYSLHGLLRFSLLFLLIWWAWLGHTAYSTRFDSDDVVQRGLTFLQMFLVAVMAINATSALDSRDSAGFAAAYSVMRLVLVVQFLRARALPRARVLATRYAVTCGAAACLWLASAAIPAPARFWVWALALAIDMGTPLLASAHLIRVPHDAAHLPERYGLFSIILLGEAMVAIMSGMAQQEGWSIGAAVSAVMGMALIFAIWWWYFDGVDAVAERRVRSPREVARFHAWSYLHFPLYLGIAVTGVGIEHAIASARLAPLHADEAWILCTAVAVVMLSLTALGTTRERGRGTRGPAVAPHVGLGVTALALGFAGALVRPPALIVALSALVLVQLTLALGIRMHARAQPHPSG
jgi:low temperature requirement protein LtrA